MLWDLIRDFFVMHVFGGTLSNGDECRIIFGAWNEDYGLYGGGDLYYCIGGHMGGDGIETSAFISVSDWLSTTATAISITIIFVLCCMFIYKIIKLIGGLIR